MGSIPTFGIMKIEDILMRNEQLVLENEALRQQIEDLKNGFEGCCPVCEPVGEMNNKLREERDELRREICGYSYDDPRGVARDRGWDCYKEKCK